MAITIPPGHGITTEEMNQAGGFCGPGYGHFYLEAQAERERDAELTFVCLQHQKPENIGKKYIEHLYFLGNPNKEKQADPKQLWNRLLYWGHKLGIVSEAEVESGEAISLDFEPAAVDGVQCVLYLKEEDYTDKNGVAKKSTKADYKGIYDVNDDIVFENKVPLDLVALEQAGIKIKRKPEPPAAGAAAKTKPAPKKPAPATAAAKNSTFTAKDDALGDV